MFCNCFNCIYTIEFTTGVEVKMAHLKKHLVIAVLNYITTLVILSFDAI